MITEEKPSLRELIKGLFRQCEAAYDAPVWQKCPLCGEEWTRLLGCQYWDVGWAREEFVCARCGEYPISLLRISKENPIPGVLVEVKKHKAFRNVKEEDLYKTMHFAIVNLGDWRLKVSANETWVIVEGEKSKSQDFFTNNFQAWSFLRKKFSEGDRDELKPKEAATW